MPATPWEAGGGPREGRRPARLSTDEVLALLVHDLRSPLGAIQNALQVLRFAGTAGPAGEQAVRVLERQVGHLERFVDDLLDLARVTTGKLELREEWLGPGSAALGLTGNRKGGAVKDSFRGRHCREQSTTRETAPWRRLSLSTKA